MINGEGYDENGYDLLGFDRNGRNQAGRTYEQDFEYRAAREHERAQALLVTNWKPLKSNDGYVATADGYIFLALPAPDGWFVLRDGEPSVIHPAASRWPWDPPPCSGS